MRHKFFLSFVLVMLTAACAPASAPTPEIQMISVYASPATQPWLADVYDCAPAGTVIRIVKDRASADITIRLGGQGFLPASVFQIATEDILIVTHQDSSVQNLTLEETRELFAGQGDPLFQVWVHASGEDVQAVFERAVMGGRSVTSFARLATSPQHMSDILGKEINSVGILPRRWKTDDQRDVFIISSEPVLATMENEPQGDIRNLLSCLQKGN